MVATTNRFYGLKDTRAQAVGLISSLRIELKLIGVKSHEQAQACHNLDAGRFGDLTDRVLYLHGDLDETDAAYPDSAVIEALGVDVVALAQCLNEGCITPEQIGKLVESVQNEYLSVADFDTAIANLSMRTPRERDLSADELDFGLMLAYGVDTSAVDECLYAGGITANQVAELTDSLAGGRLMPADFNTAVIVLHDDVLRN